MNRPTIDIEDLLDMADEAISAGDQQQAVAILRKAAAVAPLRRDVRNRLALVLEGTPVAARSAKRQSRPAPEITFDDAMEYAPEEAMETPESSAGLESISLIARKAFDAAALQKSKASDATRRLTNLLQTGLDNWKSSLATPASTAPNPSKVESTQTSSQSIVFRPEEELKQYLERVDSEADSSIEDAVDHGTIDQHQVQTSRITKSTQTSRKVASASQTSKTSSKRPTDVEDVLAAGFGGFIEAVSRMDKTKIAYGVIYVSLIGFFGFACFDVSRKFPELHKRNISTASLGLAPVVNSLATESDSSSEAIEKSKALASSGKLEEAIDLIRGQLLSGRLLQNRDMLRVELATLLNQQAESHLKANKLSESVKAYREAVSHLPNDERLKLRLANALYYEGVMGSLGKQQASALLKESGDLLTALISKDPENIQAFRLQALVQEARDQRTLARASWQKVKALAPANSAILSEAKTHLK